MHDCYFFSISFFIHYSSLKPHGLELIEMPWLRSTHGLGARPSFSEQHSEPGWMTRSNCIHIRFFFFFFFWQFMVLAIQWSVSLVTVMKTPKSLYHEPFLSPYQLSRQRLSHWNNFSDCVWQAHACSSVSGFWLNIRLSTFGVCNGKDEWKQNPQMLRPEGSCCSHTGSRDSEQWLALS